MISPAVNNPVMSKDGTMNWKGFVPAIQTQMWAV